ncbi:hypothetical protein [Azospirillum sp. B510]|uniref:hypothetical protein n=1 Tax=Azospirillum sp. (strain B510) TaxID=137722 RepID=UPI0005A890DF|nr:hypothetical protein [Azospirillum sp. B510]
MKKLEYKTISDYTKIIIMAVGALVSLAQNYGDLTKMLFSGVVTTCAACLTIMLMLDKLYDAIMARTDKIHEEIANKLLSTQAMISDLNERIKVNFEYHGLIDSPKDAFTGIEMAEIWKVLSFRVRKDFVGVNYLSYESWKYNKGDELTRFLGSRKHLDDISIRRIFVVDSKDELSQWLEVAKIHQNFAIPVRFILKAEYDKVRDEHAKDNPSLSKTNGFNVIDKDMPGISIDWTYKNDRTTDGAKLRRGGESANVYLRLFDHLWARSSQFEAGSVTPHFVSVN